MARMATTEEDGNGGGGPEDELTEPEFVPTTFVAGVHVTFKHGLAHFVGWQETEVGNVTDKRIVVRTIVPEHVVRKMVEDIRGKLPKQN